MDWLNTLILAINGSIFLAFFVAALVAKHYLPSYLGVKGKNLATKEDFDELISQVKRTTKETEEIKNQVARVGWIEQRQWDLKRELYTSLLENLYAEKEAMFKLIQIGKLSSPPNELDEKHLLENVEEQHMASAKAVANISKIRGVAGILLSDKALKTLEELALSWLISAQGDPVETYQRRLTIADRAYEIILESATRDLNVKSIT